MSIGTTGTTSSKTVAVCDTQPLTIEGVRSVLSDCGDLTLMAGVTTLSAASELVRDQNPSIVVLDKGFGLPAIMDWLSSVRAGGRGPAAVVWGDSMVWLTAPPLCSSARHTPAAAAGCRMRLTR